MKSRPVGDVTMLLRKTSWNKWEKGAVLSVKLRDDLYTLAQTLRRPYIRYFGIRSPNGLWENVNLNHERILFEVATGRVVIQRLVVGRVVDDSVIPDHRPFKRFFIRPIIKLVPGAINYEGANLIDLGVDGENDVTRAPIVQANLTVEHDRDIIEKYDTDGVWGDNHISDRLCHFFDTGRDIARTKLKIFPDLSDVQNPEGER